MHFHLPHTINPTQNRIRQTTRELEVGAAALTGKLQAQIYLQFGKKLIRRLGRR